ncbi:MAG: hypothetical protein ACP5N1_04395 [Candidatus Woesearchaeota archaeon]
MIEIISLAIILIILFLALFWFRKILFVFGFFFKAFMLLLIVFVVGSVIFGYYVIKDANDFKDNFQTSNNSILLKQVTNGEVSFIAGTIINIEKQQFDTLNKEQLTAAENSYSEDEFSELNKKYYKIFVLELESLDTITIDKITDQNIELDKTEIKEIMISDSARDTLAQIIAKKTENSKNAVLKEMSATDEDIKNYILSYYIAEIFNPKDTTQFISQLKNGNIKVYKESALFKAIKLIPKSIINTLITLN